MVFGAYPFGCPGDDAILVGEMIGFVDELPEKWQQKWYEMRQDSQYRTALYKLEGVQKAELEKRFKEHVADGNLALLLPVIQGLMRLDPSERLSASEALDLLSFSAASPRRRSCQSLMRRRAWIWMVDSASSSLSYVVSINPLEYRFAVVNRRL